MTNRFFPAPAPAPGVPRPVLVEIDANLAGYVAGLLENVKFRPLWQSESAYIQGVSAITAFQRALVTDMTIPLENRLTQLYMLLDSSLNGTTYTAAQQPNGAIVPNPAIPFAPAPVTNPDIAVGIRQQLRDQQGTLNAGYFNGPSRPATLADVVRTGQIQTQTEEGLIPDSVEDFVDLVVAQGQPVSTALASLFQTSGDALSDGGVVAAQLASSAAIVAALGAQASVLDQLNERLSYLSGENPPAVNDFPAGLPEYLIRTLGSGEANVGSVPVNILLYLTYLVSGQSANYQELQQIRTESNVNLTAVVALLRQMLGLEAVTDPVVSASLLALAECICSNATEINGKVGSAAGGGPNDQPATPTDNLCSFTSGEQWIRVSAWQLVRKTTVDLGEPMSPDIVPVAVWRPVFENVPGLESITSSAVYLQVYRNTLAFNSQDVCLYWDFRPNNFADRVFDTIGRDISNTATGSADFIFYNTFPFDSSVGVRYERFPTSVDGTRRWYSWNIATRGDGSQTPPLNMWIRAKGVN